MLNRQKFQLMLLLNVIVIFSFHSKAFGDCGDDITAAEHATGDLVCSTNGCQLVSVTNIYPEYYDKFGVDQFQSTITCDCLASPIQANQVFVAGCGSYDKPVPSINLQPSATPTPSPSSGSGGIQWP